MSNHASPRWFRVAACGTVAAIAGVVVRIALRVVSPSPAPETADAPLGSRSPT